MKGKWQMSKFHALTILLEISKTLKSIRQRSIGKL
jgi:hypothetical protein